MPSNRIVELREKQSQLVAEARERLDQITNETDEARAKELEEQHDAAMAEHDRIEGLLEREEELADKEARLQERRERERPLTDVSGNGVDTPDEGAEVTYRSAFAKVVCGVAPSDLTSEERQVLRQGMTKFEARTQVGSSDAAGGFTVPEELANVIIRTMKMWGPMYDEAVATEMVTGSGNPIPMPTVDDTANEAAARTEGNDVADDNSGDVTFGRKVLNAYSFNTPFIKWSWELDMDSIFNMENLLGDLLGERLGRIANRQLTTGSGSNAPNGIVTAAGAGLTAAATSALTFDEIISLEHSVDPAYRRAPKVRYMLNDNTLEAVRKLKDGQGNYLWQKAMSARVRRIF